MYKASLSPAIDNDELIVAHDLDLNRALIYVGWIDYYLNGINFKLLFYWANGLSWPRFFYWLDVFLNNLTWTR